VGVTNVNVGDQTFAASDPSGSETAPDAGAIGTETGAGTGNGNATAGGGHAYALLFGRDIELLELALLSLIEAVLAPVPLPLPLPVPQPLLLLLTEPIAAAPPKGDSTSSLALAGGLERVEWKVTLFKSLLCLATYPSKVGSAGRPWPFWVVPPLALTFEPASSS